MLNNWTFKLIVAEESWTRAENVNFNFDLTLPCEYSYSLYYIKANKELSVHVYIGCPY